MTATLAHAALPVSAPPIVGATEGSLLRVEVKADVNAELNGLVFSGGAILSEVQNSSRDFGPYCLLHLNGSHLQVGDTLVGEVPQKPFVREKAIFRLSRQNLTHVEFNFVHRDSSGQVVDHLSADCAKSGPAAVSLDDIRASFGEDAMRVDLIGSAP